MEPISIIIPTIKANILTLGSLNHCPTRYQLIISRKYGIGYARNWGAKQAKYELLVFLDDDIELSRYAWLHLLSLKKRELLMYSVGQRPCSKVFAIHRQDFWRVGGFDEKIILTGEDTDFQLRAEDKGLKLFLLPKHLVKHEEHPPRWLPKGVALKWECESARLFIRHGRRYAKFRRRFISRPLRYLKHKSFCKLLIMASSYLYYIMKATSS